MKRTFYDTQKEEYIWIDDESSEYKKLKRKMKKTPYRYYEWFTF